MEVVYLLVALAAVIAGSYFIFRARQKPGATTGTPRSLSEAPPARRSRSRPPADEAPDAIPAEPSKPLGVEVDRAPSPKPTEPGVAQAPAGTHARAGKQVEGRPSTAPPAPSSLERLRKGLSRSRTSEGFFGRLRSIFSGRSELTQELAAQIEEVLLTSDVGIETTQTLLRKVKESLDSGSTSPDKVWDSLASEARSLLEAVHGGNALQINAKPTVILLVGVNGAGKTTTIGKLATRLQAAGHRCVLAAGDTFRAAAVQQLIAWGERVGSEVVRGKEGADPGSVLFDAIKRAQEVGADVVLADTAGRLHTKVNLMAEMKKIAKTAERALPGAPHEVLLVIDATNGQNALAQAREFQESLGLTGIVLTKLDGTAKGGVVLGISDSLKLPVRFIGLGERPDDLHEFRPSEFVEALLGRDTGAAA